MVIHQAVGEKTQTHLPGIIKKQPEVKRFVRVREENSLPSIASLSDIRGISGTIKRARRGILILQKPKSNKKTKNGGKSLRWVNFLSARQPIRGPI